MVKEIIIRAGADVAYTNANPDTDYVNSKVELFINACHAIDGTAEGEDIEATTAARVAYAKLDSVREREFLEYVHINAASE
jgi:hypothetical protein